MKHEEIRPVKTYYNEIEPFAVEWLKGLIADGQLPDGDIDTRGIADVQPSDLDGYADCHFFAGIGGWALALRRVGVEGQGIWTGSCPCQPFSSAGKQKGFSDERHLWPEFHRLIAECRPAAVFGEQVASPLGRSWLATVRSEMEDLGYGVGAADLCAAGVGAPHIRQRLWWVAHGDRTGQRPPIQSGSSADVRHRGERIGSLYGLERGGAVGGVAHSDEGQRGRRTDGEECQLDGQAPGRQQGYRESESGGANGGLGDSPRDDQRRERLSGARSGREGTIGGPVAAAGSNGTWARAEYIECLDGKSRPVEPGIFPLAHGVPNRVGTLRGSGNAIVPAVAEVFVRAAFDVEFMA